ncbi:putative endonuclease III [Basidiobolus meristosporus CBS 931.73]|uniref:Endonuclease III homolog n=1 Tax=Basidiobolus meristosporus CBS 931.73 TaxID=1314790 RepID=A0A1Y1X733_9FUNG|nr:putative endonuclease III [Basidiobolus meristosporus CBS 931.73]|eukprot:ORX81144.1 putative endonuclease III [Basidiobolus meristosporus CBS 931.73]
MPFSNTEQVDIEDLGTKEVTVKVEKPRPVSWETIYTVLREWRKKHIAPVDTMCCDRLADQQADPKTFRFQTLVALMLSSRTKDEVTAEAMKNLHATGVVSAKTLASMDAKVLYLCIAKVGFHRAKTRFIQATAKICLEEYDGDIPKNIDDLLKLPGVGPKMAYLAIQCAWKRNSGIAVDVHVHRIANRLGWTSTKTTTQTQQATTLQLLSDLEEWLPRHLWIEVNPMLVGFGQIVCGTKSPDCSRCPVANLCPSFRNSSSRRRRVSREIFLQ